MKLTGTIANGIKRSMFIAGGLVSLFFGVIGVLLPVLPTVPFILLAAFCFARGSARLEAWLISSKMFGPIISDWQKHGIIRSQAKVFAILMLLIGMLSAASISYLSWPVRLLLSLPMLIVAIYIWRYPSEVSSGNRKVKDGSYD